MKILGFQLNGKSARDTLMGTIKRLAATLYWSDHDSKTTNCSIGPNQHTKHDTKLEFIEEKAFI
jgi:hypothetical protein